MSRPIRVLGIETSCDDTGVAIIDDKGNVLGDCIKSQLKQHNLHGGVIPYMARDYHLRNIDQVAREAFRASGLRSVAQDIDAIAVSNRPGLQHSLLVGLNYAKTLAKKYSKPLIPIHHMQAHALMPLMKNPSIRLPALALLVSGGHCLLTIMKRYNEFHILGSSRDEAPGDVLDKLSRRLKLKNLGPPFDEISGGAALERLSQREGADRFKYFTKSSSIPMMGYNNCDFSFSGYRKYYDDLALPVDSLWASGKREELLDELGHIAGSIQRAILIQIVKKLQRAFSFYRMHWRYKNLDAYKNDNTDQHLGFDLKDEESPGIDVLVSGGVAANGYLVKSLRTFSQVIDQDIRVFVPEKKLCSDNGVMIAWNGMLRYLDSLSDKPTCSGPDICLNDAVIYDETKLELVSVSHRYDMGVDISDQVRQANFNLSRLKQPELRLES